MTSTLSQDAVFQDALAKESLLHEALFQEALFHEAVFHEALAHEAVFQDAFVLRDLEPARRVEDRVRRLRRDPATRNASSAAFGFGGVGLVAERLLDVDLADADGQRRRLVERRRRRA